MAAISGLGFRPRMVKPPPLLLLLPAAPPCFWGGAICCSSVAAVAVALSEPLLLALDARLIILLSGCRARAP
jgi:hypothetical protein